MKRLSEKMHYAVLMVLSGILFLSGPAGCTRSEVELKNTVSAYTQILAESLAKTSAEKMSFFASPEEIMRIDSYILLMLKEKKVLNSALLKLDFIAVDLDKEKKNAAVTTYEEWTYHYIDEKSRQPVSAEERIAYNNVYHLIKQQGHWVVDKIDMNEAKPVTPVAPESFRSKSQGSDEMPGAKKNNQPSGKF